MKFYKYRLLLEHSGGSAFRFYYMLPQDSVPAWPILGVSPARKRDKYWERWVLACRDISAELERLAVKLQCEEVEFAPARKPVAVASTGKFLAYLPPGTPSTAKLLLPLLVFGQRHGLLELSEQECRKFLAEAGRKLVYYKLRIYQYSSGQYFLGLLRFRQWNSPAWNYLAALRRLLA
ncbi:MAG: hypothetical protein GXO42_00785 [bacterium]|nr:hypothetical protein [bacterium]